MSATSVVDGGAVDGLCGLKVRIRLGQPDFAAPERWGVPHLTARPSCTPCGARLLSLLVSLCMPVGHARLVTLPRDAPRRQCSCLLRMEERWLRPPFKLGSRALRAASTVGAVPPTPTAAGTAEFSGENSRSRLPHIA